MRAMSYRSHYSAIYVENTALRAENARLRHELKEGRAAMAEVRRDRDDAERRRVRATCLSCGGIILPVAVFAGHRLREPLPLRMSTARFLDPTGGYTEASLVHARACAACGLIHHFVAIDGGAAPTDDEGPR
jgi:hypothetical protein